MAGRSEVFVGLGFLVLVLVLLIGLAGGLGVCGALFGCLVLLLIVGGWFVVIVLTVWC